MSTAPARHKLGDLRPSQLLLTFGVGAIVDLPNLSVMVMGLEDWPIAHAIEVGEERLLAAVREQLGPQVARLLTPPIPADTGKVQAGPFDEGATVGVPVAPFPRWVLCPSCRLLSPLNSGLFRLETDRFRPDRARYVHVNCTKPGRPPTVIPTRFLTACPKGHLDDFPWVEFVHQGPTTCRWRLRMLEIGASGEAKDVLVRCEGERDGRKCEASRRMVDAFSDEGKPTMPKCRGRRPHLRDFEEGGCDVRPVTTILLGASNSWFPMFLSALSVPSATDKLAQLVAEHWAVLEKATSRPILEAFRQIGQLRSFAQFADDPLWEAIEAKRAGPAEADGEPADLKSPEWRVFSNPDPARNGRDFLLRRVAAPAGYESRFDKVVLVERLREVRALIGFTRIDSPGDFGEAGELPEVDRAPLARGKPTWVPTSEVRGEGIFLQFAEGAVRAWLDQSRVQFLNAQFLDAHTKWRTIRGLDPEAGFPSVRYVLLHAFAHSLIRQLALECGYTAASIRERIYCRGEADEHGPMAGVLIYTAAADSEGTLGGLVSLGEPQALGRHLDQALEGMRLCSSDPLCAEHRPGREGMILHGAACHACLFVPETSCERGNKYLDRSVLVRTVEREDVAFFEP